MKRIAAVLLAAALPTAGMAQGVAPTTAVDPARLAAARELIDVLLPPATREQMLQGMMSPMLANLREGMASDPKFVAASDGDPRVKAMFDAFLVQQEAHTTEMMREALPGMVPAMANAYARRFDLRQLREIRSFFETPTGRAYMQASFTIMSDPDIAAWQQQLMARSMTRVQADVAAFAEQLRNMPPRP